MVDRCFACAHPKELTLEHIIPQAVGGKLKAYLYCRECNDQFGREIDAEISKQFGKIATLLNIKRERGETQPFKVTETSAGTELVFDGKDLTRERPVIKVSSKDGKKLDAADITARSKKELQEIWASIQARYETSSEMKPFQEAHPGPTDVTYKITIDNVLLRRAIAKIAYSFLCVKVHKDIVFSSAFDGTRSYIRDGKGSDLSHANFVHTQFMTDSVRLLHKIHVAFNRDEKMVVGYVSIFGIYRFTVLLSDSFSSQLEWADLDYTFDPVCLQEVFGNERFRAPNISKQDVLQPKQSRELVLAELSEGYKIIEDYVDNYQFIRRSLTDRT